MTEKEKKMSKYLKAIQRRLNLPPEVKARVMSDLSSSVQARREAGMTEEEIYAELGDAKKAAADLNEQMKEFAYRKSPWRFLFAAIAAYGAARLMKSLFALIMYWILQIEIQRETASVGIIGGADGPTAIFVTAPPLMVYLVTVLLLTVGIWGFIRLCKCTKK